MLGLQSCEEIVHKLRQSSLEKIWVFPQVPTRAETEERLLEVRPVLGTSESFGPCLWTHS